MHVFLYALLIQNFVSLYKKHICITGLSGNHDVILQKLISNIIKY